MAIELSDFYEDFFQEIHYSADADGHFADDAFFDLFGNYLIDAGDLESADRAQYIAPRGVRIDGYGGDPAVSDGVLNLIISDFNQSDEMGTLTGSEMNSIFKRAQNFMAKSLDQSFRNNLEETSAAFGLADLISARWKEIEKIRLFLISNRILSSRVDSKPAGLFENKPLVYNVWDLSRLYRFATSGHGVEEIEIDFIDEFGMPLPTLPGNKIKGEYESYLTVVPGPLLAKIYDRWGSRLLEQNVRVFLQARGKVNKGIRNTIENEPDMFFAYNNGITATAESIQGEYSDGRFLLTGIRNFQIVNGGQTTASIHAASRKKEVDLSKIAVQMKLSVINPEKSIEVVPKISEYANTQNKVNAADFFSNHPFHVRMEEFSRRIFAPSSDGIFRQSKWFYERARGQYNDARGYLTKTQRRKFDLEYPKKQRFTKTDLAKFFNLWEGLPHVVSKGAQKNFAHFAGFIGKEWAKHPNSFNETYYRQVIAKAIVFKEVEKMVTEQPWYQGGYRANIVAYSISKYAYDLDQFKRYADFDKIWRTQKVPENMGKMLRIIAKQVHSVLISPPSGMRNVTEWAKQQACWVQVQKLQIDWNCEVQDCVITRSEKKKIEDDGIKEQKVLNGIEAQTVVVNAGSAFWFEIKKWGNEKGLLSGSECGILDVASSIPKRIPSENQSLVLIKVLNRLAEEGCQLGKDIL